jgi:ribosomal protein L7/L12
MPDEKDDDKLADLSDVMAAPAYGGPPQWLREKWEHDEKWEHEHQTEWKVTLTAIGPRKVDVIIAVREARQLGLHESKELVEKAPVVIVENLSKAEAEAVKHKLETAGGTATVD